MVIALCVVLLIIAVVIAGLALAVLFAPADDTPATLYSRDARDPDKWTARPLRSDSRRLAAPAFANR